MRRIFKHGDIQKHSLSPEKELNILILNAFLCHYIQELYTFKDGPFFGPPLKVNIRLKHHEVRFIITLTNT